MEKPNILIPLSANASRGDQILNADSFKKQGYSEVLKNTGFVLNAMHSREGCYTYIKEIIKGESYIPLGAEEKKIILSKSSFE